MVHCSCIPNIFLLLVLIHSFCCATTTLQQQIRTAFKQNQYSQVVQLLSEWNLKTPHAEPSKKEILTQFELLELLSQSYDFLHNDDKAIETYERLLTLQAKYKTPRRSLLALNGLGLILSSRGQGARAIDLMHEATKVASKNPAVWNNYATTQHKHGALQEAVRSYKKAFVLSKFKVKVYGYNFANALMDVNQYKKAISTLQTVIKLDNTFAEAHWKLGRCYASSQVNKFKKAVRSFRAALRHVQHAVKFTKADVLFELHDAYLGLPQPKHNKAIQSLEQAVALAPNNAEYIFALEHLYRYTVHFSGLQSIQFKSSALLHKELEQPQQHKRSNLSPMRALTFLKPDQMIKLMKGWSASMLSFPKVTATANRVKTSSTPVLRIGFLSSEWETNSPTMHIMDRLPTLLKTSSVHVYALKNSPVIYPDSTPLSSMENVVVRRFEGLTNQKIAQLITNDALDFLIDLNGYTAGGQPEVLGMLDTSENPNNKNKRGNKVSTVSYLGWPSTFGHSNLVQYAVVDRYVVTIETSALHFTERLFILPHSFFVGDHDYKMKKYMMQIKNHDLSALRMHHRQALFGKNHHQQFVFCNFNQLFKLSIDESDTLQVW
jgi:predicted O-linked N-acetylglucosamine transferase (SPINDLY family)